MGADAAPTVSGGVSDGAHVAADTVTVEASETRHLMVDIETLGSRPGAAIASIGAVVFTPSRVISEWECVVNPETCQLAGLKMDAATVMWWMRQSDAARASTFGQRGIDIHRALTDLAIFATDEGVSDYWSHGATFDLVILSEAALTVGAPQLVKDFRRARDTRTLYEITGVNPKTFMGTGTAHKAVDDARAQALAVIESWRILQRWKNAATEASAGRVFTPWGSASVH